MRLISPLVVPYLVLLATGCGSASSREQDQDQSESAAATASEASSVDASACSAAFFTNHPHTGTVRLSTGQTAPTPFWACDFDITVLYGVMDYDAVARLAEGTGYAPYATTIDGAKKAFARLFVNTYQHSDGGAYHETVLTYDVTPGATERAIPWVNAYSAIVPSLDPADVSFAHRLYLDHALPIVYGRDVFGYDKRRSHLSVTSTDDHETFSFTDERGDLVSRGQATFDDSPAALQAFVAGLEQAVGVSALPPPPPETSYAIATRDVERPGRIKRIDATFQWSHGIPTTNAFDASCDGLSFEARSEIGALLGNAHFRAMAVAHDSHANMVMALLDAISLPSD